MGRRAAGASRPGIVPVRVLFKDLPQLKDLSIRAHTLCYLARGIGDDKTQLEIKSSDFIDPITSTLKSLRIYGHEQPRDYPYLDHEYNFNANSQIE